MDVRIRQQNNHLDSLNMADDSENITVTSPPKASRGRFRHDSESSSCCGTFAREMREIFRATIRLFKGEGSAWAYLFIPALISLLWILVCLFTVKSPSMTLEERLSQKYLREYFEAKVYEDGLLKVEHEHHEPVELAEGETVNIVMAMPFLDVNPLGATEYITALEWILIYSTVPITFHVITNTDSVEYIDRIFERVNLTANVEFHTDLLTLADIMDKTANEICPKLIMSEEFCDILMGKMTPLLFPYLFPKLDHVIYVDRKLMFQEDIGMLYKIIEKMKKGKAALAMAPEQSNTYMRAFAGWQRVNPSTRLGRPPPDGKPGFNPDLILMDLEKLRASATYKSYFNEKRLNKLVRNYFYHSIGDTPSIGDMVNLMAADTESLFEAIGCEWNRNAKSSTDLLDKKYNVCPDAHHIKVWNGNPNMERIAQEKDKSVSVGKKRVENPPTELR